MVNGIVGWQLRGKRINRGLDIRCICVGQNRDDLSAWSKLNVLLFIIPDPGQKPENGSGGSCGGSAHLPIIKSHFGNRITLFVNSPSQTLQLCRLHE